MRKRKIKLGSHELLVEIARSPLEKMKGMSFRKEGKMLFVFNGEVRDGLHMATLSIPLQMIFFNSDKEIIEVKRAEPWSTNPKTWNTYRPEDPYGYVLESSEFLDLSIGEEFKFLD